MQDSAPLSPPQRRSIPFNLNTPPSAGRAATVSDVILQGERDVSQLHAMRELDFVKAQLRKANESLDRTDKARTALADKLDVALAERDAAIARLDARENDHSRALRDRDARIADLERANKDLEQRAREESQERAAQTEELAVARRALATAEAELKESRARVRVLEAQLGDAVQREETRVAQLEAEKRAVIDQAEAKTLALIESLRQVQADADGLREQHREALWEARDDYLDDADFGMDDSAATFSAARQRNGRPSTHAAVPSPAAAAAAAAHPSARDEPWSRPSAHARGSGHDDDNDDPRGDDERFTRPAPPRLRARALDEPQPRRRVVPIVDDDRGDYADDAWLLAGSRGARSFELRRAADDVAGRDDDWDRVVSRSEPPRPSASAATEAARRKLQRAKRLLDW